MITSKYLTIEDFKIVDVAIHCDWSKINIAIDDCLNFDFPEYLCDMYGLADYIINLDNPTEEQLKILNGDTFICQNITKKFLGLKSILVYYSYANYLMGSTMNDSGVGFVAKRNDGFSVPIPLKDIEKYVNSYRNRGYSVIKQLREYLSHNKELIEGFNIDFKSCNCGCGHGKCDVTEKRIYTFTPKLIKKRI